MKALYQALYRKLRPRTFDDVVGQEPITTTLKNEIRGGRPSHAYLLIGSRGTGKTTCAKLIAKAVNCLAPQDGNPCGICDICRGIDNGSVVDVVEIDAASNSGVDNIRELREEAGFLPTLAKYRVYIIDEAHMLSMGAVNALLKIMEEPPEHVIFILATTEAYRIPATIQSRCQRFDFRRIASGEIGAYLGEVAEKEGIALTEDAAMLIGRLADGGMRDALSLLDLCASHSGSVTVETVSMATGLVGQEYLFDLAEGIREGRLSDLLTLIDEVGAAVEVDRICAQLVSHFRNLLVAASAKDPGELIVGLPETIRRYQEQAKEYPPERILYAIHILQEAQTAMSRTSSRRAQLEIAAARLCDSRLDASPHALLDRMSDLERKLGQLRAGFAPEAGGAPAEDSGGAKQKSKPPAPAPDPNPPQSEGKQTAARAKAARGTGDDLPNYETGGGGEAAAEQAAPAGFPTSSPGETPFGEWQEVQEVLGRSNPALKGALAGTTAYLAGNRVLIDSDNSVFLEMMRSSDYTRESLKDAIAQVTGVRYSIGPYTGQKAPAESKKDSPLQELLRQAEEAGVEVQITDNR